MKKLLALTFLALGLAAAGFSQPSSAPDPPGGSELAVLVELARGHERSFKSLTGDRTAVVLQKGEKQFTIFGVTNVRALGAILEITVKNGDKYSVSPTDVFFITNNPFKI